MHRRSSPLLLGLAVLLVTGSIAGSAVAGTTTGGTTTTVPNQPVLVQTPDPVLTKLNQIQADLDDVTAKLVATTTKLDAQTAKLDALKAKTDNIYDTTHYTKGYVQGGIPTIMDQLERTCGVADEARDLAAYAAIDSWIYAHIWHCL